MFCFFYFKVGVLLYSLPGSHWILPNDRYIPASVLTLQPLMQG
ncbi:hypothetical Protein YC6258_03467 [Gynuella sunshinyii YC6258]|uniref:Uncharacterized protein n=1 Tax=Gynuella sunshinyii YC6258 TaxID=1445510 RepID=A0A0C5VPX7_9GAMM|nr:hypothetical Protein YC6258_03467 [Gynuella sunshinyii YC6258]